MVDIKTDSRLVKPGDTFIAIRNVNRDGHDYIESAIENGATKIIAEEGSYSAQTVIVENTRAYLNEYLYQNYYPQFQDMKFIGVTGTNGKTTICYLIYQMLTDLGYPCAYIGTIGFYYPNHQQPLNNTTPDTDLLYNMFLEAKEAGCKYVVMEVSSHALDMNRIYGITYDEVAFTNLTQDHLDYHKTLENYAKAKQILFTKTRGNKIAVINADDPHHDLFMMDGNKNITISDHDGDAHILDIHFSNLGTKFSFELEGKTYETSINMVGRYNVYNYLTAFLLVKELGFDVSDILALNETLSAPVGRMEMIKYGTNSIFVDYAHTPDAVENVLQSSKEYKEGKVITIIGCGGDRDRTKRPLMGHAAEEYSDYVIYTSDNPRTEDPNQIMTDILEGVKKDNHEVIMDREEAIQKGMSLLNDKDVLMILGKGHENYQIIGTVKHHFSDQEVVLSYIEQHS